MNTELDKQVAEALGLQTEDINGGLWIKDVNCFLDEYSPSTNWEQCGKLIEEYKICVAPRDNGEGKEWGAFTLVIGEVPGEVCTGATPLIAACKAIVAKEG